MPSYSIPTLPIPTPRMSPPAYDVSGLSYVPQPSLSLNDTIPGPGVTPDTGPQPPTLEPENKNAWLLPLLGAIIGKATGNTTLGFAVGAQGAAAQQEGIEGRNKATLAQYELERKSGLAEDMEKSLSRQRAFNIATTAGADAAISYAHSMGITNMDDGLRGIEKTQEIKEKATTARGLAKSNADYRRETDKAVLGLGGNPSDIIYVTDPDGSLRADFKNVKLPLSDARINAENALAEQRRTGSAPKAMNEAQLWATRRQLTGQYITAIQNSLDGPDSEAAKKVKEQLDEVEDAMREKGYLKPPPSKQPVPGPEDMIRAGDVAGPPLPVTPPPPATGLSGPGPVQPPAIPTPATTGLPGTGAQPGGASLPVGNLFYSKPPKPFNEKAAIAEMTGKSDWTTRDVEAAVVDAMSKGMDREAAIRYVAKFLSVLLPQ